MNNKNKWILILVLFFSFASVSLLKADAIGEIEFRLGELSVKNQNIKEWKNLDEGDPVSVGDTLKTGIESRCEIILNDGSSIRLSEKTEYVVSEYSICDNQVIFSANLLIGEAWNNVYREDKTARDFKVKTPIAVAAVIGTIYKSEYDGKESKFSVLKGKVKVDLNKQKKKELNIQAKSSYSAPKASLGPKQIAAPFEVSLKDWMQIVKGETLAVRQDGRYAKSKFNVEQVQKSWDEFKKIKNK